MCSIFHNNYDIRCTLTVIRGFYVGFWHLYFFYSFFVQLSRYRFFFFVRNFYPKSGSNETNYINATAIPRRRIIIPTIDDCAAGWMDGNIRRLCSIRGGVYPSDRTKIIFHKGNLGSIIELRTLKLITK